MGAVNPCGQLRDVLPNIPEHLFQNNYSPSIIPRRLQEKEKETKKETNERFLSSGSRQSPRAK
jgi:hypothetical protein